jgi:diguanylate cyclase (GGDEF)-like protein
MSRFPERSLRRFTLPLAAVLGAGVLLVFPLNPRLENTLNQLLPSRPSPALVVVGIDDASLRDYGRPDVWPRELYAQVLQTLGEAGVRVVGLDVLLSGASSGTDAALAPLFSTPHLVLATSPGEAGEPPQPGWRSPTGVSVLNRSAGGVARSVQTAYELEGPGGDRRLVPSFAGQIARLAGGTVPTDTAPRLLRYVPPGALEAVTLSFRDVVNGNVRFAELQDKVVLIGLTASGFSGLTSPDLDGSQVSGTYLQARAVSSLLAPPLTRPPLWLMAALGALLAAVTVWLRGLWGFGAAALALGLAVLGWLVNLVLPGVSLSLAALVGVGLVTAERWWQLRGLGTQDGLTGVGNRLAFTRAVEHRWHSRQDRPMSLMLIDLDGLRQVNQQYGHLAGDTLLRDLAGRLQKLRRRGDIVFRWGPDEFAVLLDQVGPQELPALTDHFQRNLGDLRAHDLRVQANIGAASTSADVLTPSELIEAASRSRYRMKYRRGQTDSRN